MNAILCATLEEEEALRAALDLRPDPHDHGPFRVWIGRDGHEGLVLARSGVGKVNAAAAATILLSAFGARAMILAGVAGGLAADLEVGAVILAARLSICDYGVVTAGRFIPTASGLIPIGAPELTELAAASSRTLDIYEALAARVGPGLGHPIRLGGLLTGDYFLNCAETRETLRAQFGADAIDMESGAVRQVCEAWGVDLYVIRTLSDLAGADSSVTYGQMAVMAAANSAACVPALLTLLAERDDT
jgi:adenosylhomocysteine nucleosidase